MINTTISNKQITNNKQSPNYKSDLDERPTKFSEDVIGLLNQIQINAINKKIKADSLRDYNFAEGKFESLPGNVFRMDPNLMSRTDRAILEAIKFQMTVSKANNMMQRVNYSNTLSMASKGITFAILWFFIVSLTYYANVNLNLGMDFLTEMFA